MDTYWAWCKWVGIFSCCHCSYILNGLSTSSYPFRDLRCAPLSCHLIVAVLSSSQAQGRVNMKTCGTRPPPSLMHFYSTPLDQSPSFLALLSICLQPPACNWARRRCYLFLLCLNLPLHSPTHAQSPGPHPSAPDSIGTKQGPVPRAECPQCPVSCQLS